jgi:hypothetical protein
MTAIGTAAACCVAWLAGDGTTIVLGEDAELWECSFAIAIGTLHQGMLSVYQWSGEKEEKERGRLYACSSRQ